MLTQFAILKAAPKEKSYKLSDGQGLYLLIEPSGSKLWRFRYQWQRKEQMLSLGSYPEVSLAQARQKRDDARKLVADGKNPSDVRREEKLKRAVAAANTFGAIALEPQRDHRGCCRVLTYRNINCNHQRRAVGHSDTIF